MTHSEPLSMKPALTKILILVTVILMDILSGAELDLFVPSFPELQSQFDLTPFWVEALLSANFAGFCLSLFFVGSLGDKYGRKPIIMGGLLIFILGSLCCLYAPSYSFLLTGRFLQGVGISAPATLCFLIIADAYPIKEQQYLIAMLNGVVNASIGAAPVAGSYITLYFHWQGNFVTLLLFGILVGLMTLFFIPADSAPKEKEMVGLPGDLPGYIKSYLPIFQFKPLILLITNLVFLFTPYWVFVGMSPLLYIEDLGVSLRHFGYYQGLFACVFAVGSVAFGFVLTKFDQKKMLYLSCWLTLLSLFAIGWVTVTNTLNPLWITLAFLVFVVGQIIPSVILFPVCLSLLPQAKGKVSAILKGGYLMLTALGLQLAGYFYVGSFQNIGIILMMIISGGLLTLVAVLRNKVIIE